MYEYCFSLLKKLFFCFSKNELDSINKMKRVHMISTALPKIKGKLKSFITT